MTDKNEEAKGVDFGVIVAAFVTENVAVVRALAKGNDKAMVRGYDQLGSSMIIKGAEMMLQAGAPPELVIQRVALVVKEFRSQELREELESSSKKNLLV